MKKKKRINKISSEEKENELIKQRLVELIVASLTWDKQKIEIWFELDNPNLGGISPNSMITLGRSKKLEQWIRVALVENIRD